jgi:hypothetical protein
MEAAAGLERMEGKGRPWRAHARTRLLPENDPVRVYLRAYRAWLDYRERSERD